MVQATKLVPHMVLSKLANRTPFAHKRYILVGVTKSNNFMHKRDHCSEDTKISKYPKNIIEIHNRLAETISIIKPQAYGGPTYSEAE